MSVVTWGSKYECDRCEAASEPSISTHMPEGWTDAQIRFRDGFSPWLHLCPACAELPYNQLVKEPVMLHGAVLEGRRP
jgi:hypothetical protein